MSGNFPWLTVLAAVPFAGALLVAAVPAGKRALAKNVALLVTLVELALAIAVTVKFSPNGDRFQLTENHTWIKQFGVHWALGVDGIGVVLILLTAVLMPVLVLASWNDADAPQVRMDGTVGDTAAPRSTHAFFALMLAVEAMVVVSFAATDIFVFYVFFEAMLIPMYFLIGGFGGAQRSYAAVKFLLYNLLGGLVMLAAVVALYVATADADLGGAGQGTFDLMRITQAVGTGELNLNPTAEKAMFLGFMFAFAVKAPLWPFHTWLPDTMTEATPGIAVLVTAMVDKVGTFAMLRYCLALFPNASKTFAPLVVTLAIIGIIYGALLAVGQTDIKRLIAYTSISHFGFIIVGIFALTSQGQSGATLYMVNHGFSTAALLLVAGFLISRRGSKTIADFGGVQKVAPLLAGTFLVAGLATLSLPGLAPFVSEFLVLVGTFSRYQAAGIVATFGIILAALYVLVLYQRTMTGPVKAGVEKIRDLNVRELVVVAPLIALLLVLGVYPKPVLDVVNPAVDDTLSQVEKTDPAPSHPIEQVAAVTPLGGNK
ncbi:NADH-quinone oxidoreductase subunit M [Yinghuangia seranimata]|uniref:NADH-quinone oxidoreductase subunit M n=1 Tax=Yinghuangia seranimata TaxID=408067 RepID=UPI00248B79A8|nr:NADH-quinone oxidoreductase subunit M [Yinghuangia seranimata]MDI2126992.1 NADH-quinone oxidoreductase subunit M [Yinghuangia seranimata]